MIGAASVLNGVRGITQVRDRAKSSFKVQASNNVHQDGEKGKHWPYKMAKLPMQDVWLYERDAQMLGSDNRHGDVRTDSISFQVVCQ